MTADDSPRTNRIVVGIDLGTTNSLAAVVTRHGPRVLRAADGAGLARTDDWTPGAVVPPPGEGAPSPT